jgi:phosphoglycolate phosphatase
MDAYLFDLDGTLIDSFEDIAISANHARRAVGLPDRPVRELVAFVGEGAQRLIERAIGPERPDLFAAAMAAWREHYATQLLVHTRPYPGVVEALGRLKGPKAVVSNKPGESARRLVGELGLAPFFVQVIGGGDVTSRKPDPEGCRRALAAMGAVDRVVFVGDSVVDAQTARSGGYAFVGVLWGQGTREQLAEQGAHVFAERPGDLPGACASAAGGTMGPR